MKRKPKQEPKLCGIPLSELDKSAWTSPEMFLIFYGDGRTSDKDVEEFTKIHPYPKGR